MNLKNKIGDAAKMCATSIGLIEGVSLFITDKGLIKKELSKKDDEYAHVYVKNGKLIVDYAKEEKQKPGKTEGKSTGKATKDTSKLSDTSDAKLD